MHALLQAIAFFTRLPVPASVPPPAGDGRARAAALGSFVGWIVGAWGALVYAGIALVLPPTVAAALAIAATVWLTGALHEDGFADFCDGFGAGGERDRVLAVMADSRSGVYAVLGITLIVVLRWSALVAIAERGSTGVVVAALVAGHACSRFLCVSLMHDLDYIRPDADAKGRRLASRMDRDTLAVSTLGGVLPVALFWWLRVPEAMLALAPAVALRLWVARSVVRVLGGYTGDCLGAVQQLTLAAFYLGVAAAL